MEDVLKIVKSADSRMEQAVTHFQQDLQGLRTGRATTGMVETIAVEQYGQMVPLRNVATIATPDAQTISIRPWDKTMVAVIEKTLRETSSLGLNPSSDGEIVRLNVPPMTEERRREIAKELGTKMENAKISLRQIRHDILNEIKKMEKTGDATQDDAKYTQNELDKKIDSYNKRVEEIARAKEADIMTV